MRVSDCCGAHDGACGIDGPDFSDVGICPECREHCEFVEEEEDFACCESSAYGFKCTCYKRGPSYDDYDG